MTTKLSFLALISCLLVFLPGLVPASAFEMEPRVTFTFDDGARRIYENARPIFAEFNLPAVIYGETGPLNSGEDWVMTWDQIRELQNVYGWEIGSHTINHPYLTQLSDSALTNELSGSKQDFSAKGIEIKTFATPYGDYNNKVLAEIAKYYESHRAAWGGANFWPDNFNDYELVSLEAAHTISPETVQGWIDTAVANKQWLIVLLHDVVSGVPIEYEYNIDDLKQIVAYAASQPIKVTTMSEALNFSDQPNLISNFTFSELDSANWALDWSRTNTVQVVVDTDNHGNVYGPKNSLKITAGASQYELRTPIINIDPAAEYMLKMYQRAEDLTAGGWAVWINEYDESGAWLGGQWLGGNYSNFIGTRYYEYKPSSLKVKKAMIHIFTEEASSLTLYIDSVSFQALTPSLDTTPPLITLLGSQVVDLTMGDAYVEAGATAMDNVDGNITSRIVIGGDIVNTSAAGAYLITYNVSDAAGNKAVELVRTVNVLPAALSDNANLSDLKVNNVAVAGFSPAVLSYSLELPAGTLTVPVVTAATEDAAASAAITPALSLPGTTTIMVTAENNISTRIYAINFTVAAESNSMIENFSFESLSGGWAIGWTRLDGNIAIDTNNKGYSPFPQNSLKIPGGADQRVAASSPVNIDGSRIYSLSFYQNIADFISGGAAVWVDEFNSSDHWVSGAWLGGNYSAFNGVKTLDYAPTSSQVAKIQIHLFTEENSQLTLYIDSVVLREK